jgi:hypothetical protein
MEPLQLVYLALHTVIWLTSLVGAIYVGDVPERYQLVMLTVIYTCAIPVIARLMINEIPLRSDLIVATILEFAKFVIICVCIKGTFDRDGGVELLIFIITLIIETLMVGYLIIQLRTRRDSTNYSDIL